MKIQHNDCKHVVNLVYVDHMLLGNEKKGFITLTTLVRMFIWKKTLASNGLGVSIPSTTCFISTSLTSVKPIDMIKALNNIMRPHDWFIV